MLSESLLSAFNDQINRELHSAYLYRAMASAMETMNYPGMAEWMKSQAAEENEHAEKFIKFIEDRGNAVKFQAIDAPKASVTTPLAAFQAALEHEQSITGHINDLYAQANKENDFAAQTLLDWFVTEQVEEEASVGLAVEKLKRAGNDGAALLMLDSEFGQRSTAAE